MRNHQQQLLSSLLFTLLKAHVLFNCTQKYIITNNNLLTPIFEAQEAANGLATETVTGEAKQLAATRENTF
jgi:hypothetical protein